MKLQIKNKKKRAKQPNIFQSYSTFLDFSASLISNKSTTRDQISEIKDQSIQFKVTSFNVEGVMGKTVVSKWMKIEELMNSALVGIEMQVEKEIWNDDTASVLLNMKSRESSLTVCSLTLSYLTHTGHPQSIEFVMDRSRGFLLERLAFDRSYSIQLEPTVHPSILVSPSFVKLHVPPCIQMVNDPSLCAPPPVNDISWRWNISQSEGQTVVLSWEYDSSNYDMPNMKGSSHARMVHFDVSLEALSTLNQPSCQTLDSQRRVVTWTHRSVILYIPDDRCNYEVGITVVDSRNRRSTPVTSQILRFEEQKSMLAMTASWNVEMFLLVSFMFAIVLLAGGMAVCRARDRNEFNTLKTQHRQLTKSIVVAQSSASTLPRSQCLTVVDGRGRPISSDSEISAGTQNQMNRSCVPSRAIQYYGDEGVYDSLDTPTRSEISYLDRMSACSFHRANPIYSNLDLQGQMVIPFDRLHASHIGPAPNKSWINANALDKHDVTSYWMKYSIDDCPSLRHEFSVVSRISTDHPNLVYFHGLAVRDCQIISLLFEPVRGGTLFSFLNDVRTSFMDRDEYTPSPSSSGYDGSNRSEESLDRFQQKVDRLVSHLYEFAMQIANGLSFLHAQRCAHGRVSSENVYLLKTFKDSLHLPCDQIVKLGDFDNSLLADSLQPPLAVPMHFMSPEGLQGKPHTTQSDIWQFGLLLCELVSLGSSPSLWEASDGMITDKAVKTLYSKLNTGQENTNKIDPGLVLLKQKIPKCLSVDPKKRISARELEKELFEVQPQSIYGEHVESVEV